MLVYLATVILLNREFSIREMMLSISARKFLIEISLPTMDSILNLELKARKLWISLQILMINQLSANHLIVTS